MTLPDRYSLLHSDLNDFLFASVGDQQNGMPLNVFSALTRLDVDPWEEAARLAALPKSLAAEALEPMIARLPIFAAASGNLLISQRLVELLPAGQEAAIQRREQAGTNEQEYFHAAMVLTCLGLVAVALYAML